MQSARTLLLRCSVTVFSAVIVPAKSAHRPIITGLVTSFRCYSTRPARFPLVGTQQKFVSIAQDAQQKKRISRRRTEEMMQSKEGGNFSVTAFATAEQYNLEKLLMGILKQDLYEPKKFLSTDDTECEPDVLYVTAKYQVASEPRGIFFFREGTVVMWNIAELESSNVLSFLKGFEEDSYDDILVTGESEHMAYNYSADNDRGAIKAGRFFLANSQDNYLERYTFSNAMSLSVKLGIWEATLERYINSMEYVTDDLKRGSKIKMSRADVLRKTGELFALRHMINLSSDLLDTPDFYWEQEQLETLYSQICNYFVISRRTRVMNEKLNHCIELADLISSNLNDLHHVRLEWMIIILIMVEVSFEVLHYVDRFVSSTEAVM